VVPATRTYPSVTFPATLVVRGLPASEVCVQAEQLDDSGNLLVGGSETVQLLAHRTTLADIQTSNAFVRCPALIGDMGSNVDGGVCPAGALFCDDFESGTFDKWTQAVVKYGDMGTIAPSMTRAAHGAWSAEAKGSGLPGTANHIAVIKALTAVPAPVAMRANIWSAQPLTGYTMVMSLYDDGINGFSMGGDSNARWVVTEDQTVDSIPDHVSSTPTATGWHCVEMVVDGGGMFSAYVDGNRIIGPLMRAQAASYTTFTFGLDRTVQPSSDVFVDDVAIGTTRLYCP